MKLYKIYLLIIMMMTASVCSGYPGQILKQFKTPYPSPTGLTFDGKNLWIADHKADKLISISPLTGETIREIPSPGFWPMGLAWDGKYLWNIDGKQKKIFQVDPVNGTILRIIDSPSANPEGLAWDGNTLWVSDNRAKKIMKLDLSDGTAVKSHIAPSNYVQGLTFDGTYFWCSDRILDEIYMIQPDNGEVILILKSPGPYPRGLTYDGKNLWNVDYQKDSVYQMICRDGELFKLSNRRKAEVTFTHEVKSAGSGLIKDLNVYIAIPEDLPQQVIFHKNFNPTDFKIVADKWNQKYAHFNYKSIRPDSLIRSIMKVETEISEIYYFIFPDKCGTVTDIPADLIKLYTANDSKYLTDDPFIQKLAIELKGKETNPYWIARNIFDYVRNTLEYKLEGGWNVAPVVLKRGTGSCSEYTFSFISLCRAAGIPARYVGSIVVRGDDASLDDVFHRWPEIYLPNYGWVPIDPQGGDKDLPRDRAMNIGQLSNRFLITTQCGGDTPYMGWYYNSYETYTADPQVQVNIETFGEWEPLKEK